MSEHQDSDQIRRPFLMFAPYLPMPRAVVFAKWWLGPLKDFDGPWESSRFEELSREFLASFLDTDGKRIENLALLARADDGVTGQLPTESVRSALQRAIDLAVLDGNPDWEPDIQGWWTTTTDCSELFVWPIDVDEGSVAVSRGSMVEITTGGLRIGPDLVVPAAPEVHIPWRVNADEDLLAGSYAVFSGAHDDLDANLAGRLGEATTWLAKAWRNTASIRWEDRVVTLKVALDALTGSDKTAAAAGWLERLFRDLGDAGITDADVEHLLWSPSETRTRKRVGRNGQPEACTDLEHWVKSFGDARNEIVHTGKVPALTYDENGSAYNGPFVFIGERLIREAIRLSLAGFGYANLWQAPLHRAIAKRFREAEQEAAISEAGLDGRGLTDSSS